MSLFANASARDRRDAKPKAPVRSEDFFIGLKAHGTGKNKRWLVNYFVPASGGGIVPNVG